MLKALELAKSRQLEELKHLTSSTNFDAEKKIEKVKSIFNELQIDSVAKAKMEEYYQLSLQALNAVNVSSDRKHELLHIASRMMKRTS
jgi:geranylgeranyl diphosphate synthase type II